MSQHDVTELANLLDAADFICLIARRAVEDFCGISKVREQVDHIEGRVKTLASVLRKSRERRVSIEDIDDLVGSRVVVLAAGARDALAEELVAALRGRWASRFDFLAIESSSIMVEQGASEAGYTGTLIRATLLTPGAMASKIRCEFQIRTIQQDAWARTSHLFAYKKRTL